MARESRPKALGSGQCSYKRITLIVCFVNIVIALFVLRSLYSSLYIYSNKDNVVKYTPDQIRKMEESDKIRRASEPIELVKLVKRIKHELSSDESLAELPRAVKHKITDEILQRLRSLRPNASISDQQEAVETWRKEKLKEAKTLALGGEGLNSTLLQEEAGMLVKALESNWAALSEEIGLWIPTEVINQEHNDKPEGVEDTEEEDQILAGRPLPPQCHAELHTDYDGAAVKWGLTHHKESAADCCQACLDQAKNAKPGEKKCNIWVYCPSENGCYSPDIYQHKHMECWLKFSEKPRLNFKNRYSEQYRDRHPKAPVMIPWVSGIQPFVSLTHYDIPQELENRYGAWLSSQVQEDFKYHADICFKYFGDRVKYWTTFNEPNVAVIRGYRSGIYPPSRCSSSFGNCSNGDSEKEPFIAAHNIILSHAAAVDVYRTKYQKQQGGSIGIVMNAIWYEPISNSLKDKQAAERAQAFYMNWFLDPIIMGKYPKEMQEILDFNLPSFSNHDQEKLNSTGLDFIGINHYTSFYTKDCMFSVCEQGPGNTKIEGFALRTATKNGVFIGESTALDWLFVHPQGMEKIITYVKERYNNIPMFITENGFCENDKSDSLTEKTLNDVNRVEYISGYLDALAAALRKGADVRGYFLWSLLDNFEWTLGFTIRFGLHHVDFTTLKRTPRGSATWYKQFIANHTAEKILMPQHYPGNQLGQHFNTI